MVIDPASGRRYVPAVFLAADTYVNLFPLLPTGEQRFRLPRCQDPRFPRAQEAPTVMTEDTPPQTSTEDSNSEDSPCDGDGLPSTTPVGASCGRGTYPGTRGGTIFTKSPRSTR